MPAQMFVWIPSDSLHFDAPFNSCNLPVTAFEYNLTILNPTCTKPVSRFWKQWRGFSIRYCAILKSVHWHLVFVLALPLFVFRGSPLYFNFMFLKLNWYFILGYPVSWRAHLGGLSVLRARASFWGFGSLSSVSFSFIQTYCALFVERLACGCMYPCITQWKRLATPPVTLEHIYVYMLH